MKCPLCGRDDCSHTQSDIGLSADEFIVYCVSRGDKDYLRNPEIKREVARIEAKVNKVTASKYRRAS